VEIDLDGDLYGNRSVIFLFRRLEFPSSNCSYRLLIQSGTQRSQDVNVSGNSVIIHDQSECHDTL